MPRQNIAYVAAASNPRPPGVRPLPCDQCSYARGTRSAPPGTAEGTVYPALTRLEREGRAGSRLIASHAGPARKYHRPTGPGYAALAGGPPTGSPSPRWSTPYSPAPFPPIPPHPTRTTEMTMRPIDRLRVERAVWTLDAYLADLPRRSRVAQRREVRANLRAAADDVGTTEALRRLGSLRRLAAGYLAAEFGESRPPVWKAGAAWLLLAVLVLDELVAAGQAAYGDGVRAANPHAAGTFTAPGFAHLTQGTTYLFSDGGYTASGGAFTPLMYVFLAVGFVLCARLWRQVPARRRAVTGPAAGSRRSRARSRGWAG